MFQYLASTLDINLFFGNTANVWDPLRKRPFSVFGNLQKLKRWQCLQISWCLVRRPCAGWIGWKLLSIRWKRCPCLVDLDWLELKLRPYSSLKGFAPFLSLFHLYATKLGRCCLKQILLLERLGLVKGLFMMQVQA